MANHVAVKVGGWAFRDPISHQQISGLQTALLKCPNFDEGSTHTPSGLITVAGANGMSVSSLLVPTLLNATGDGQIGTTAANVFTLMATLDASSGIGPQGPGRILFWGGLVSSMTGDATRSVTDPAIEVITNQAHSNRNITLLHADAMSGDWKVYLPQDPESYALNLVDETAGGLCQVQSGGIGIAVFVNSRWYANTGRPNT